LNHLKTLNDVSIKDPLAVLNALKLTDSYMKMNESATNEQLDQWNSELERAKESLVNINQFHLHETYWNTYRQELNAMMDKKIEEALTKKTIRPADKIKVARIIADMLGVERADDMSSPTQLINMAMRKVKTKPLRPEMINVLQKMLKLADDLDIKYDKASLHPKLKLKESAQVNPKAKNNLSQGILRYNDFLKLMALNKAGHGTNPEVEGGEAVGWRPSSVGHTLDVDHQLRRRKVKYHLGEEVIEEDKATLDYKLSKSGRKVPARHLIDKDAKHGDDKGPEKENELKLKKEKDKIQKAHQGKDDELEESYMKEDEMEMCDHEGKRIPCSEVPEDEITKMVDTLKDDDDELEIVDDETGEKVADVKDDSVNEEALMEVLSRVERIRAKIRFARHKAKRGRKLKIAMKRRSAVPVLNRRARKLAIRLVKQRLAKKPLNKLSVGEKERLERIIQKRKQLIGRVAMRLVPRIRKVESGRLAHKRVTGKPTATGF
jgi:hypothetical protein